MPDIGDFIRRSRRLAKIAIAAPGTPGDFRRSAYKIAKSVADLTHTSFSPKLHFFREQIWRPAVYHIDRGKSVAKKTFNRVT